MFEGLAASPTVTVAGGVKAAEGLTRPIVRVEPDTLAVTAAGVLFEISTNVPEPPLKVDVTATLQLVSVTVGGFATTEGHPPAPAPVAFTVTVAVLEGLAASAIVTVADEKLGEPFTRLMVRVVPDTLAVIAALALFDTSANVPEPPLRVEVTGTLQLARVTAAGFAATVGQGPAPAPVKVTVTGIVVVPSEIDTVIGLADAGDGFARVIVKVPPVLVTTKALLPELAVYVPVPPVAVTLALVEQVFSVTAVGPTTKAGGACVPGMFAAVTVVVWPAESRIVMGTPGAGTQMPTGEMEKLQALHATKVCERAKAELVFATK